MSLLFLWPLLSPVSIASGLFKKKKKKSCINALKRWWEERLIHPCVNRMLPPQGTASKPASSSTEAWGVTTWNKSQSFRPPVNSHHIRWSPMWNCILWGIWFPCSSCTQEMTCGSDTGSLCEQMPPSSLREAVVCHLSVDSCMGYKFEDTGPKGRGKSLLTCRHVCLGFLGNFDIPQCCLVTWTWVPAPI